GVREEPTRRPEGFPLFETPPKEPRHSGLLVKRHAVTAARRGSCAPSLNSLPAPGRIGPGISKDFVGLALSPKQERLSSIVHIDHGSTVPRRRRFGCPDPTPSSAVQLP